MSEQCDWLLQVPINPDDMETWTNTRAAHLAHLKPYIEAGTIVFAGPTLATHPKTPDDEMKVTGSVMLFKAGTAEEVRAIVKENPFVGVGIWDMERAVVTPFQCAVRRPAA